MNAQGGGGFSLANMFRSGAGPSPNNAAIQQEGDRQQGGGAAPGTDPNNPQGGKQVVPNSGGMPVNPVNPGADLEKMVKGANNLGTEGTGGSGSPLDAFTDFFKIDPNNQQPQDPLSQKLLEVDPAKLSASISKMDFTRNLDPALVTQALQGDTAAFGKVLNQAFQGSFAASMQMMAGVMEQAFSKNNGRFNSVLEGKFKDFQINSASPQNKLLNHPAAKPVLQALRQQIANSATGRGLSPADINQKAEEYFLAMGDALGSLKGGKGGEGGGGGNKGDAVDIDWSVFETGGQQGQNQ